MTIYKKLALSLSVLSLAIASNGSSWETMPDTWVTDDEIGRTVASSDSGVDRTEIDPEATVGMFYYVWHGFHNQKNDKDITEILEENVNDPQWGGNQVFHWGSTPWLGRYAGTDDYKTAKHFQMLTDAGVDFIILDLTNAVIYTDAIKTLFKEYDRREALGLKNLKICPMLHARCVTTAENYYKQFVLGHPENDKYWFRWLDKPLMLLDLGEFNQGSSAHHAEIANYFTMRDSWAWQQEDASKANEWSWLEFYPQNPGFRQKGLKVNIEQISVGVAQHATTKIGKSSTGRNQSAATARGTNPNTPKGLYFAQQWERALEVHPPVVMITQFNEWIAQRFIINDQSQFGNVRPGAKARIGETYFVDVYTPEFSRDLEPSRSPYVRDNYYLQMVSNIRKYRGVHAIPEPKVAMTIDIDGDFAQWDKVDVAYTDEPGDTYYTSKIAQRPKSLLRKSNDIVCAKVTKDDQNYYFYVECDDAISDFNTSDYWMRLLINSDCNYTTGWSGYDYMLYKDSQSGEYSLMKSKSKKNFTWQTVQPVEMRYAGKQMMVAVPRSLFDHADKDVDFDFKWADNFSGQDADVMSFISDGEAAPNGRFNYRYKGSKLQYGKSSIATVYTDKVNTFSVRRADSDTLFVKDTNESALVDVYDISGRCLARQTSRISLPAGIYIAHCQGCCQRFCVL